jgi:two-component system phosphate regulon sensor histidine kinase PhoR
VTDLLVLAKLEGESRPPTDHAVDMRALFDHLKEDAQTLSNGHHDITFSIDETLGVTGAQTEVFSAFANLVTNAMRYTPDGGKIAVSWRREGGQACFRSPTAASAFRRPTCRD